MSERNIKAAIRLALCAGDTRLFNNPVGVAIYPDGAGGASRVPYGLVPGASDLVGWHSVTITPQMVGQRVAIFAAVETKAPRGHKRAAQRQFIDAVLQAGGRAGFARSVDEAVKIIAGD